MISTLTTISFITGGLLILLLLVSIFSGLELDLDFGADTDVDSGGIGIFKGLLTIVSVGSWVVKIVIATNQSPWLAFLIGITAGLMAMWLLNQLLKLLLRNEVKVNWKPEDALFKEAKTYLKIPISGSGIVHVDINGATRELKAKTNDKTDIPTGTIVYIKDYIEGFAIVSIANQDIEL